MTQASQPTLFLSDLHLSPSRLEMAAAFRAFCEGPARKAAAIYVLGDLFNVWVGDDQLRDPLANGVAQALRSVATGGVPVHVMRGNRDLLLGEKFARAADAILLPDSTLVDLHGTPTLLMHGDLLCTDDVAYQRFREWAHDPARQRRVLRLPYFARRAFISWLRRRSRIESAMKPEVIMDVNADAVAAAFREHAVTRMIHGHTHRPARHEVTVDGRSCERWVLSDWYDHGSYLEVDDRGARARELTA